MYSKVYIIGKIPDTITLKTKKNFYNAQKKLQNTYDEVFNPMETFLTPFLSKAQVTKINMDRLINSDVVYILADANSFDNNFEFTLVTKIDLLIIHELVF